MTQRVLPVLCLDPSRLSLGSNAGLKWTNFKCGLTDLLNSALCVCMNRHSVFPIRGSKKAEYRGLVQSLILQAYLQ